jgi:hypothetical protein
MPVLDLERLSSEDVATLSDRLREAAAGAASRQQVCERITDLLYEGLRIGGSGEPACVLARCFQTCHYARLPVDYQHAAEELLEQTPSYPNMRCLALMATRGMRTVWNDVATSMRHQCIPLPSVEVVERAPMIARLLDQVGISVERLVARVPLDAEQAGVFPDAAQPGTFNTFHITHASGSPFVPAQAEFIEPFGVKSVLGLGGLLLDGNIFAVILFTRVPVSDEVAAHFGVLGPFVREALLPFPERNTFASALD